MHLGERFTGGVAVGCHAAAVKKKMTASPSELSVSNSAGHKLNHKAAMSIQGDVSGFIPISAELI